MTAAVGAGSHALQAGQAVRQGDGRLVVEGKVYVGEGVGLIATSCVAHQEGLLALGAHEKDTNIVRKAVSIAVELEVDVGGIPG